jgi:hypothetical protein
MSITFCTVTRSCKHVKLAPSATATQCFCRPAYSSYKSIEKSSNLEFWLQYWTIFGLLTVIEYFLYFLVRIIPLYAVFKLAFLTWMQLPQSMVCYSYAFLYPLNLMSSCCEGSELVIRLLCFQQLMVLAELFIHSVMCCCWQGTF